MKIKLKWIIFILLFLCSCAGNRESEKNNNFDADGVPVVEFVTADSAPLAKVEMESYKSQNIVEVVLDSISTDYERISPFAYMKNTPSSYPFDKNYTLKPFMLFKNVDPNYPDTPDSIASLLVGLKAEIHKDKLILTDNKTGASCDIYMSFDEPFEWNSENEKHYYFYDDKLSKYSKYGNGLGSKVLRVVAKNDIEECNHYGIIPNAIYVYGKYIIMKYLDAEKNCSLWFYNPWYEEKCRILARSKDTIDHFFEDETIPFESISVDTTQRVICSSESVLDDDLEQGDDDNYYHIIHKTYAGYKCYVGEIPNEAHVKILPTHASSGYNVMIVVGTYGADSGDYWSLYVYKNLETINQESSSIEVGSLEEADPFENEGDYRILTFKIYEDFTIRVDGERRIGSVVDKVSRYYRITDQGEIREVKN
ncbi:MAG: hypothetical protein IKP81_12645 [Paludibacteraceae bacterium]|nr:hypothetical protein [Paludibacteraceae bacterium]